MYYNYCQYDYNIQKNNTVILSNFRKTRIESNRIESYRIVSYRIESNRIESNRIVSNRIFFKNLAKKKQRIKLSNLFQIKIKN